MRLYGLSTIAFLAARLVVAQTGDAAAACTEIQSQLSPGGTVMTSMLNTAFADATYHWFFVSSSQVPTCVVEVATPQDVSMVMQTIGKYRAPWNVKSGGHISSGGHSSTSGVHISLTQFNQTILSPDKSTAEIGFGLLWSDVYAALNGTGYNVVGGRVDGPGVGGFTLGGGYSWKTNQYGLTSDTVKLYNVVLPNGTITTATATTNPDLFWALKGGMNRFGVVTSAEFYTNPQTDTVFSGVVVYSGNGTLERVMAATQEFSETNTDPKAQIITTTNGTPLGTSVQVLLFYDGPDPGNAFTMFDGVESTVNLTYVQTFAEFIGTLNSHLQTSPRGSFATLATTATSPAFLNSCLEQTRQLASIAGNHSGIIISFDIEPFLKYGQHAVDSAFPHAESPLPLNLYFSWIEQDDDEFWLSTMRQSIETLKQIAIQDNIFDPNSATYPNYAPPTATAEQLYTPQGAGKLRAIREAYDPQMITDLAGGWAI